MSDERAILIVAHTAREEAVIALRCVYQLLVEHNCVPVMVAEDREQLLAAMPQSEAGYQIRALGTEIAVSQIESVIVLGGDGTILRAAEIVRDVAAPILGVNLGHVGFLAESERHDLAATVQALLRGEYRVEARMALYVQVMLNESTLFETWALNEAAVEKASRERMLEVCIAVDDRPVSSFGCDGVVMSTPTGSTAYSFSAGGPVVWPTVEALLMVPLSAHSLFNRPLVVDPGSKLAVELLERNQSNGVLWCDGRRSCDLPPGARVNVQRSEVPVRLARFADASFSARLVDKFQLPVEGWRGSIADD